MPIVRPFSLRPFSPRPCSARPFSLCAVALVLASLGALLPHAVAQNTSQPASGGALRGVYAGVFQDHSRIGRRFYYFTADGWVTNNIPAVNMDSFDINAYRSNPSNRLFVGRYRVDGNQVHIVWANDENRREIIKVNNAAAEPAIDTYIPTCQCEAKRFSGTYHWGNDERFLQFSPDGTFVDHGLIDQIVGLPNPHGYAGITDPPRNFRGTYSVHHQQLTFHFADGKQATVAFIVPRALENAPTFDSIGVGHGTGVPGAETVVLLMLFEKQHQVEP